MKFRRFSTALLVAGAMISTGLVTAVAVQAATSRAAPINSFDGVDEVVEVCTTSSTFVTIPQTTRTFSVGGSVSSAVVAMFQGALSLSGSQFDTGFLRLTVDGVQQTPGEVPAIGAEQRGTHGFNWQTRALSPGTHTARVQWRTDRGSQLCADARSLIVMHK